MHDFYKKRSLLIMNKKNIRVVSGMQDYIQGGFASDGVH